MVIGLKNSPEQECGSAAAAMGMVPKLPNRSLGIGLLQDAIWPAAGDSAPNCKALPVRQGQLVTSGAHAVIIHQRLRGFVVALCLAPSFHAGQTQAAASFPMMCSMSLPILCDGRIMPGQFERAQNTSNGEHSGKGFRCKALSGSSASSLEA